MKRFIRDYSDAGLLDAAIVLTQPAAQHPTAPLVIPWSTGAQSTASQIDETANSIVSRQAGTPAGDEGPLADLFRLALPAGFGDQGPLIKAGLPAIRLSSAGELPLDPGKDTTDDFNTDTFSRFGRASLALILALDASPGAVQHGPSAYIGLAGNLLPGWTIAMLALALLFPVALAAGAGIAASARSPVEAGWGFLWAGLRAVPFLGALLIVGAATLVGLMPSPDFPFDPRVEALGLGGTISVIVAILAYCTIAFFLRPLRLPGPRAAATAAPAAVLLACLAALGVWAMNPYLAVLVALGLQAWLFAATRPAGRAAIAGLILLGLVPLVALVANLASRFDAGLGVWHDLLLMLADGQIGVSLAVLGCLFAGSGVAIIALGPRPQRPSGEPPVDGEISVRRRPAPLDRAPAADEIPDQEDPPETEAPLRAGSVRAGEGPAPLVEAAGLDLAATRQLQGHALALGDVADLGELGAAPLHRLGGGREPLGRQGDEQLVVLSARRGELKSRSAPPASCSSPSWSGIRPRSISSRQPLALRDVAGIGTQPVADVDHRSRALGAERQALVQPRRGIELPGEHRLASLRPDGSAVARQQGETARRTTEPPRHGEQVSGAAPARVSSRDLFGS